MFLNIENFFAREDKMKCLMIALLSLLMVLPAYAEKGFKRRKSASTLAKAEYVNPIKRKMSDIYSFSIAV